MARPRRPAPPARDRRGQFRSATGNPPEPKDTDRLERWKSRLARAKEIRDGWATKYDVEQGERFFLGEQTDLSGERSKLSLNRVAATLKTIRPNLFFQMPKFFVRPKPGRHAPVASRIAASGEGVLEAIAQQDDNLEIAGSLAVTQAFFRLGCLKISYDPRMEANPRKGEPIARVVDGEPVLNELSEPELLRDPMTGEVLREPEEVLTDEVYRWRWVDAANLLLPDEGPDPTAWTWIGEEIVVPLKDAKQDARFPAALRAQLVANETYRRLRPSQNRPQVTSAAMGEEFLRYTEAYDIRAKRWVVYASGQSFDDFLVDEAVPRWIDNDPYALLLLGEPILGPDPLPWPVPVVRDWLHPQQEYNIRRRQIMEGAKRAARKVLYTDAAFADEDEATKALQSPDDMQAAKVNDLNAVKVLDVPPLSLDIWRDIPLLDQDWRNITGQPGTRMAMAESGTTATADTFAERASSLRDSDMQKAVTRWLSTAGRKMFQCVKETLTLELWVQMRELDDKEFSDYLERVYGFPKEQQTMMARALPGLKEAFRERFGQAQWLAVTREDLIFEADVTVAPGSTRPRNLDTERADWFRFLEILGRAPQLALSRLLLQETAAKFGGTIDERMLDELTALAQKMVEVNARQAGRDQGADAGGANGAAGPGGPRTASILQALMTGQGGS